MLCPRPGKVSREWQLRISILARSGLVWNETQQEPLAPAHGALSGCLRSTLAHRNGRLLLAYANEGQVFLHSILPITGSTSWFANVTEAPMLDFETQEPMQVLACSNGGPQATSFQMISMPGLGFFVFYVSPSGDLRVSSLLVSRFQVSWLPSNMVLSADGTNSTRRFLWLEKLLVNIGDYGLLFEEMFEESRSMRLAIGHFVDKEPHLDLVTVLETTSRRFAQVPSGALLLGDANGLRFAVREAASLAVGPPVSVNVVDLRSVQVMQLYSEAVLVTPETLQLVADYRCQLPASGHQRYDISNCSGNLEASRCKLACRQDSGRGPDLGNISKVLQQNLEDTTVPEEGFAKPQAMCPEEGGIFQLNGCSPPRCFLPAEVPLQFNVSMCSTSPNAPLSEEECALRCRSGLGVRCPQPVEKDQTDQHCRNQDAACEGVAMGETQSQAGETTYYNSTDHAIADDLASKHMAIRCQKAHLHENWAKLGLPSPAEGGTPWYWFWSRMRYGKYPPARWVEGITIVEENEYGEQWTTHVQFAKNGTRSLPMDESFSQDWSRRQVNRVC
eukprot:symbB.v1.2.006238.t1/scaffold370.1/size393101/4